MATTAYPYATGKDPTYDAWKAQSDYQRAIAQQDADFARKQADENYQLALSQLDGQAARGARSINTSMLGRGVYRSGETSRRQAELGAEVLKGKEAAGVTRETAMGKVSTDLQRAMTSLDLQNEQQVQAAIGRQTTPTGGGGGARTTTRTVAAPRPAAPDPWDQYVLLMLAQAQQAARSVPKSPARVYRSGAGGGLPMFKS